MQRITVICVGKLKEKFYLEAAAEYQKRLTRFCRLELVELPEQRLPDSPSPAQVQQALGREAEGIREKLPAGAAVVALCIEGELRSSQALAQLLAEAGNGGQSSLAFVIGGSYGLHTSIKSAARLRLSMSPMTFPHHLARIMLLEQLYRGYQILEGGKYHK